MTPTRWRKRPVVVDAVQVTGKNAWTILDWIADGGGKAWTERTRQGIAVIVETPEGLMRADLGDWVIREPNPTDHRRFYPAKDAIFQRGFDRVVLESPEVTR